jgi:predicted metalloendopeptidase
MRDNSKRISVKELNEKYPFINWKLYFEKLFEFYSINKVKLDNFEVKIHDVKLLEKINNIILESDIKTVTTYLEWYAINELYHRISSYNYYNFIFNNLIDEYYQSSEDIIFNNDNNLPTYYYENDDTQTDFYDFENELPSDHEFYHEDTFDEDDPNSKIEHCARVISDTMPDAITKFIADNVYSINVKNIEKELKQMFNNIKEAMVNRISNLEWLEEETKKKGLEKLEKKKLNIGINDVLNLKELYQKYQYLENRNIDDFTLNLDANIAETGIHLKNLVLNGSFDDDVMINAFNDEETNTIHISYPIVHSPFYIDNEKDYLNYGAIGMVIAHELIHSYDNNNRYIFANEGNISWLTEDDNKDYDELIQCFIDQYNHFLVKDGKYIDGEETLAENIADNGSISKAYDAWKLSLLKDPENASKHNRLLPGFSDYTLDQLFYISFAQTQCKIENDYFLTDTHSTGKARINVVLQNSEHFAKTFNCPLNSSMNPESKCVIW